MDTHQIRVLQGNVNKAKIELNKWEREFQEKHGRKVTTEDVKENNMVSKYKDYNKLKKSLAKAKAELQMSDSQMSQSSQPLVASQTAASQENHKQSSTFDKENVHPEHSYQQVAATSLSSSKKSIIAHTTTHNKTRKALSSIDTHFPAISSTSSTHKTHSSHHTNEKDTLNTSTTVASKVENSITNSTTITTTTTTTISTISMKGNNDNRDEHGGGNKKARTLILNGYNKEKAAQRKRRQPQIVREMEERKRKIQRTLSDYMIQMKEQEEQRQQSSQTLSQLRSTPEYQAEQQFHRQRSQLLNTLPPLPQDLFDSEDSDEELPFSIVEDNPAERIQGWSNSLELSDIVKLKIEKGTLGEVCEFNKKLEEDVSEDLRRFIQENTLPKIASEQSTYSSQPSEDGLKGESAMPVYKRRPPRRQTRLRKMKFVETS
ncbi:hypothetical protein BDF20DRAFT_909388 [Mycotypha africana]|uniref:uncharacterized protein n=1 Tax=Mycotypha africana TaxID=64632 RepID=UPI0022FFFB44|nr:uncharacterized protein BDF20DRAFT_909388 [Mycotypha africana]KAI8991635.1 hypothetical protein BDF20DRAFT_909388 [Mycotypha africana]